jgi:single-strand DNA-binding protein
MQMIGHLGRDCTQNEVNGKTVLNFPVAHSEKFKDQQGNLVEKTVWVNCSYWTDRPAVAPYLLKGTQVYLEGAPEAESYMNKENQAAASLKLKVFSLQLLGSKPSGDQAANQQSGTGNQNANASSQAQSQVEEPADDLPF